MASSDSPPAPHHTSLPNPKKRPSLASQSTPATAYAIKRPKLHPLRQTSYPDAQATPFSATPSARSETGSLISGSSRMAPGSAEKRGRGRPRKGASTQITQNGTRGAAGRQDRDDGRTLISMDGGAGRGARSVVSGRSGADEDDEPDLGWAAAPENLDAEDVARKEEEEQEENRKLLRLMSTFTPEQEHRYRMYKRSVLNKSTLKRIVNQTVSQSVTALPLIAIGSYSKYFVGEIVTRALDVQKEWAQAFDERKASEQAEKAAKDAEMINDQGGATSDEQKKAEYQRKEEARKKEFVPNPHKGGLLPDHLREALRRYKGDGEGGGVGFGSTSQGWMGQQGAGAWRVGNGVGGRRLFR